jgi:hypothetical protein
LGDEPVDCFARAMAGITPQRLEREKRQAKQTGAYLRRFPLLVLLRLGRVLAHPAQHAIVGLMNARSTEVYSSEIAAADI